MIISYTFIKREYLEIEIEKHKLALNSMLIRVIKYC